MASLYCILISSIVATSVMTAASYGLSRLRQKQFREPQLLNELLVRLRWLKFASSKNHVAGWTIHYGVGVVFVLCYELIRYLLNLNPTIVFYVLAGAISGLVGILVWALTFRVHPNPPEIDFKEYYIQLFMVHILFGLGTFIGMLLLCS